MDKSGDEASGKNDSRKCSCCKNYKVDQDHSGGVKYDPECIVCNDLLRSKKRSKSSRNLEKDDQCIYCGLRISSSIAEDSCANFSSYQSSKVKACDDYGSHEQDGSNRIYERDASKWKAGDNFSVPECSACPEKNRTSKNKREDSCTYCVNYSKQTNATCEGETQTGDDGYCKLKNFEPLSLDRRERYEQLKRLMGVSTDGQDSKVASCPCECPNDRCKVESAKLHVCPASYRIKRLQEQLNMKKTRHYHPDTICGRCVPERSSIVQECDTCDKCVKSHSEDKHGTCKNDVPPLLERFRKEQKLKQCYCLDRMAAGTAPITDAKSKGEKECKLFQASSRGKSPLCTDDEMHIEHCCTKVGVHKESSLEKLRNRNAVDSQKDGKRHNELPKNEKKSRSMQMTKQDSSNNGTLGAQFMPADFTIAKRDLSEKKRNQNIVKQKLTYTANAGNNAKEKEISKIHVCNPTFTNDNFTLARSTIEHIKEQVNKDRMSAGGDNYFNYMMKLNKDVLMKQGFDESLELAVGTKEEDKPNNKVASKLIERLKLLKRMQEILFQLLQNVQRDAEKCMVVKSSAGKGENYGTSHRSSPPEVICKNCLDLMGKLETMKQQLDGQSGDNLEENQQRSSISKASLSLRNEVESVGLRFHSYKSKRNVKLTQDLKKLSESAELVLQLSPRKSLRQQSTIHKFTLRKSGRKNSKLVQNAEGKGSEKNSKPVEKVTMPKLIKNTPHKDVPPLNLSDMRDQSHPETYRVPNEDLDNALLPDQEMALRKFIKDCKSFSLQYATYSKSNMSFDSACIAEYLDRCARLINSTLDGFINHKFCTGVVDATVQSLKVEDPHSMILNLPDHLAPLNTPRSPRKGCLNLTDKSKGSRKVRSPCKRKHRIHRDGQDGGKPPKMFSKKHVQHKGAKRVEAGGDRSKNKKGAAEQGAVSNVKPQVDLVPVQSASLKNSKKKKTRSKHVQILHTCDTAQKPVICS